LRSVRWRLHFGCAQGGVNGLGNHPMNSPTVYESNLAFRWMHVHINGLGWQRKSKDDEGMFASSQAPTVRLLHGRHDDPVPNIPTVDKQVIVARRRPSAGRPTKDTDQSKSAGNVYWRQTIGILRPKDLPDPIRQIRAWRVFGEGSAIFLKTDAKRWVT